MSKMQTGVKLLCAALMTCFLAMPVMAGPVDINKADAATIANELKGIGPAKAKAIVDYRAKNGPFKSVDDLRKVGGIGDGLLSKIRGNIVLNGSAEPAKK